MLRFDIAPVCSNAYRFQATMSFTIAAYLFTPWKWVAFILAIGGFIRVRIAAQVPVLQTIRDGDDAHELDQES